MTHLRAQWSAVKSWSGGTSPLARFGKTLVVLLGMVSGAALAGLVAFGCQQNSSVTPPPPTVVSLKITAPATSTAGSAFSVTVSATDSSGEIVTGYVGTVQLTSSDTNAVLPGNHTFTTADNGVFTFTGVTLKTASSDTITATDTTTLSITGKATVAVTSAVVSQLKVTVPTSSAAGSAFSATVSADDSYGNVVTS